MGDDAKVEELNKVLLKSNSDEWWHKTLAVEEKFFHSEWGRWRLKTWWKPRSSRPHCIMVFEPEGFLVKTLMGVSLKEATKWIEEYEEKNAKSK